MQEYKGSQSTRIESKGNNGEGTGNVAVNTGNNPGDELDHVIAGEITDGTTEVATGATGLSVGTANAETTGSPAGGASENCGTT